MVHEVEERVGGVAAHVQVHRPSQGEGVGAEDPTGGELVEVSFIATVDCTSHMYGKPRTGYEPGGIITGLTGVTGAGKGAGSSLGSWLFVCCTFDVVSCSVATCPAGVLVGGASALITGLGLLATTPRLVWPTWPVPMRVFILSVSDTVEPDSSWLRRKEPGDGPENALL